MTQNYRKLVGLHDKNWTAEAVHFGMNEASLTLAYPKWFIDLLMNQHPMGYSIQFHQGVDHWFLRNPLGPDYQLTDKESWIVQTCEGHCSVYEDSFSRSLDRYFRDYDSEFDS